MRKTLCGIAIGGLILVTPGVASAQLIDPGDGLVDVSVNVQDVAASAPVTASGNQVTVTGDNTQTGSNNNRITSVAGRDNDVDTGDRTTTNTTNTSTIVIDGDGNTVNDNDTITTVRGDNNRTVVGNNNQFTDVSGDDNNVLVDSDGNTIIRGNQNRVGSDNVTVISDDDRVTFVKPGGLRKAVLAGLLPERFLTHRQVIFPARLVTGTFATGGGLAKTGQDYGLFVMAALAMITAGYVVTRMSRLSLSPAALTMSRDTNTLVVPEPDQKGEPEAPEPDRATVVEAASSGLKSEIAALRRQLDQLVPTGQPMLAGV